MAGKIIDYFTVSVDQEFKRNIAGYFWLTRVSCKRARKMLARSVGI